MNKVKQYIENANLIQKVFLFVGLIAFGIWFTEVRWVKMLDAIMEGRFYMGFSRLYDDGLFSTGHITDAIFVMFFCAVGSYIFKPSK